MFTSCLRIKDMTRRPGVRSGPSRDAELDHPGDFYAHNMQRTNYLPVRYPESSVASVWEEKKGLEVHTVMHGTNLSMPGLQPPSEIRYRYARTRFPIHCWQELTT